MENELVEDELRTSVALLNVCATARDACRDGVAGRRRTSQERRRPWAALSPAAREGMVQVEGGSSGVLEVASPSLLSLP
jgi:hypothetical protein